MNKLHHSDTVNHTHVFRPLAFKINAYAASAGAMMTCGSSLASTAVPGKSAAIKGGASTSTRNNYKVGVDPGDPT